MVNDLGFTKRELRELGRDFLAWMIPISGDLQIYRETRDNFGSTPYAVAVAASIGTCKYGLILGGLYEILK